MSKHVKFSSNNFSKGLGETPLQLSREWRRLAARVSYQYVVQMKVLFDALSLFRYTRQKENLKNWNESCLSEGRGSQGTGEEAGDEASGLVMAWRRGESDARMGFWVFLTTLVPPHSGSIDYV